MSFESGDLAVAGIQGATRNASVAIEREFEDGWSIGAGYLDRRFALTLDKARYDARLDLRLRGASLYLAKKL